MVLAMIGKTISHYKIIRKLGEGGAGKVFLANDLKLNRQVAIKIFPDHLLRSRETIERFEREARAAAATNHPNIITIYDIIETDGRLCIIMEYVSGQSLREIISRDSLTLDKIVDIISQISQGLMQAHKQRITHRDIKPENIIINSNGIVKILDFGLAKLQGVSKLTKDETMLGTTHYMSPEQITGQEVDHRTDIWSLGIIFYELITNKPPFEGDYDQAVSYAILNEEPLELKDDIPEYITDIVYKCLAKNPDARFNNIGEIIGKLDCHKNVAYDNYSTTKRRLTLISIVASIFTIILTLGYCFGPRVSLEKSRTGNIVWENSIAILPFVDLSQAKDQEWFCDGMTEQVISSLGRLVNLKVSSRQSVMQYKNSEKTIPEIGKELNVANILESSIRKHKNRIRITVQLIKADDGFHIWAQDFDRNLDDIFKIQDDISEKIATNLLTTITQKEKEEIKTKRPRSAEAYEYYMKGRYFHYNKYYNSLDIEDFFTAEKMLKKSISLDNTFADSYASLGDLYNSHYNIIPDIPEKRNKLLKLQEAYLDTAYQLDPNSAEVNYAKGVFHVAKTEDEKAFECYKKAISINPNNDIYYSELGSFLYRRGCVKQAIKLYDKAIEISSISALYFYLRGVFYWQLGEYQNAAVDLKKAIDMSPDSYSRANATYWMVLIETLQYEDARLFLEQLISKYPDKEFYFEQAVLLSLKGEKDSALSIMKYNDWYEYMIIYSLVNMNKEAIAKIEEDLKYRKKRNFSYYFLLKNLRIINNLKDDPQFQNLLTAHKKIYDRNLLKYNIIKF